MLCFLGAPLSNPTIIRGPKDISYVSNTSLHINPSTFDRRPVLGSRAGLFAKTITLQYMQSGRIHSVKLTIY